MEGLQNETLRTSVLNGEVAIADLDRETVRSLLSFEIERASYTACGPDLIGECLQALGEDPYRAISKERYGALAQAAIAQSEAASARRFKKLRKYLPLAAAVLLLGAVGTTVGASDAGPFSAFVDDLADLMDLEVGKVYRSGSQELLIGGEVVYYSGFEEMLAENDIDMLWPHGLTPIDEDGVELFYLGDSLFCIAHYEKVTLTVQLTNPISTEEFLLEQRPDFPYAEIGGRRYYIVHHDDFWQYTLYDDGKIYLLVSDNSQSLDAFAATMK